MATTDDALAYLERDSNNALERLKAFLSIPSVTTVKTSFHSQLKASAPPLLNAFTMEMPSGREDSTPSPR